MRLEIIANHSVEMDIMEALQKFDSGSRYTIVPSVHGVGSSNPRLGDPIWPEENFMLVIYCDEEEASRVAHAVADVKARFPDEGIKLFAVQDAREIH
jgi:hypothetical protein